MDQFHKGLKWISHNRFTAVGMTLVALSVWWLNGCESKTASVLTPGALVTRGQFAREVTAREIELLAQVDAFKADAQAGQADLDQQDATRAAIVDFTAGIVTSLASGRTMNPAQAVTSGVTLLGIIGGGSLLLDNRRKDKKIKANGGVKA